jgi:hypothetical protein
MNEFFYYFTLTYFLFGTLVIFIALVNRNIKGVRKSALVIPLFMFVLTDIFLLTMF